MQYTRRSFYMYIALIAESIADRRYMERLLDRASDSLMETTGNLYIEAFGDASHLWNTVNRYDVFILDFFENKEAMYEIIDHLFELNVNGKIIVCYPDETWLHSLNLSAEIYTLKKPIKTAELEGLICTLFNSINFANTPTVELRGEHHTRYIPADDIIYAVASGHTIEVFLADNSFFTFLGTITDFAREVCIHPQFVTYAKKGFSFNHNHIKEKTGSTVTMTTGHTFKLPRLERPI